jgi:hypothetical protein
LLARAMLSEVDVAVEERQGTGDERSGAAVVAPGKGVVGGKQREKQTKLAKESENEIAATVLEDG